MLYWDNLQSATKLFNKEKLINYRNKLVDIKFTVEAFSKINKVKLETEYFTVII